VFLQETEDCTYMFEWPSPLACPYSPLTECGVTLPSNEYSDLSELSVMHGATSTKDAQGNTYYINVCSRVNIPQCDPSAGACMVTPDGSALNLGTYLHNAPVLSTDGTEVFLTYTGGSACPHRPGLAVETKVTFVCKPPGAPTFTRTDMGPTMCQYEFEWATCLVCPGAVCPSSWPTLPTAPTTIATTAAGPRSAAAGSGGGSGNAAVIAVVVVLVAVILAAAGFVLYSPARRARIMLFLRRNKVQTDFRYKKVAGEEGNSSLFGDGNDDDEDDDELMPM
jgi:hypothetical protein